VHASAQGGPPLAAEASWEVLRAPHGRVTALAAANDGNHLWSGSSLRNPDPFQGLTAQLSAAKLVSIMAARCTAGSPHWPSPTVRTAEFDSCRCRPF